MFGNDFAGNVIYCFRRSSLDSALNNKEKLSIETTWTCVLSRLAVITLEIEVKKAIYFQDIRSGDFSS